MISPMQQAGRWLHQLGANVTAIELGAKGPAHAWDRWQRVRQNRNDVDRLPWQGYTCKRDTKRHKVGDEVKVGGVGVINGVGGWRTFDLDARKGADKQPIAIISDETVDQLLSALGLGANYPWVWRSGSGAGWAVAVRCNESMPLGTLTEDKREKGVFVGWPPDDTSDWHHIELRWENNQTVYPPSESGRGYTWRRAQPTEPPALLPLRRIIAAFFDLAPPPAWNLGTIDRATADQIRANFDLVAYARRELGGESAQEGREIRILGHQGLLIDPEKRVWYIHGEQIGGDALDLVAYCAYRSTARNLNGKSAEILEKAAEFAGVALPDRASHTIGPGRHPTPPLAPLADDALPILLSAAELHRIPPAIPLIPDVLYVNTLHQFFGAPGSAKSFLALDIACTVAQSYRVLYVAAEAIEDYEPRINAWTAHYGCTVDNLYFWREPLHLSSEGAVARFIAQVGELSPALVIFDPLADCMRGLDESGAGDMSIAIANLNTIRRATHAAVGIVHHSGWNDERERGSSLLRGACRIVAKVEMRDDGLIRFSCVKKNQGEKFQPRLFRLVAAGDMGSVLPLPARLVLVGKSKPTDTMLRVIEALTTEPLREGATHTQIQQDTQIPAGSLNRVLTVLADSGYVRAFEDGRSRKYTLTENGRDVAQFAGDNTRNQVEEEAQKKGSSSKPPFNWVLRSFQDTGLTDATSSKPFHSSSSAEVPSSTFSGVYINTRVEEPGSVEEESPAGTVELFADETPPGLTPTQWEQARYLYGTGRFTDFRQLAQQTGTGWDALKKLVLEWKP